MLRSSLMVIGVGLVTLGALGAPAAMAGASPSCDGRPATIVGTSDDDVLNGTPGPDVIVGLGGDDTLRGREGWDVLCGGGGDDILVGRGGRDRLFGDAGEDLLIPGAGDDLINGGADNDRLDYRDAGAGVRVSMDTGNQTDWYHDKFFSIEVLLGSSHDDHLILDVEGDAPGDGNTRWAFGRGGDDRLDGLQEDSVLWGGAGDDELYGAAGDDRLYGGSGRDILYGGYDDDRLIGGGGGADQLYGGPGTDECVGDPRPRDCESDTLARVSGLEASGSAPTSAAPGPADCATDGLVWPERKDAQGATFVGRVVGHNDRGYRLKVRSVHAGDFESQVRVGISCVETTLVVGGRYLISSGVFFPSGADPIRRVSFNDHWAVAWRVWPDDSVKLKHYGWGTSEAPAWAARPDTLRQAIRAVTAS